MRSKAKENPRQRFFFDVFIFALLVLVAIFSWSALAHGWLLTITCIVLAVRFAQVEFRYFYAK